MSLKIVVRFLQYLSILLVLRPYGNIIAFSQRVIGQDMSRDETRDAISYASSGN